MHAVYRERVQVCATVGNPKQALSRSLAEFNESQLPEFAQIAEVTEAVVRDFEQARANLQLAYAAAVSESAEAATPDP